MARRRGGLGAVVAILAAALAATTAPAATAACRCAGPPSMLKSYFRDGIESVVIATPQRIVPSSDPSRRTYALVGGNTTIYKGCPRKLERISVFGPATSCSTTLTLGEPVLLFLSADRFAGPCDYTLPVSALTPGDVAFLNRRTGCGGRCAADNQVDCFVAPCTVSRPCDASGRCEDNYCGGCHAEWYRRDGSPMVCAGGRWGGWYPTPSLSPVPVPTRPPYGLAGSVARLAAAQEKA